MSLQLPLFRLSRLVRPLKGSATLGLSLLFVVAMACAPSAPPPPPPAATTAPAAKATTAPAAAPTKPAAAPTTAPAAAPTKPAAAPTAAPAPAAPKTIEKVSLRLDFLPTGYHAGFFVAADKGWYRERGLEVEIGTGTGSVNTVQQVAAGQADFGFASGNAVIQTAAKGAPVLMVANPIQLSGACFIVREDSGITSLKGLEGKTVGDAPGGFIFALIPPVLKAGGADPSKVTIVAVDPAARNAAFLDRKLDGIPVVCGDSDVKLEAQGGFKVRAFPFADYGFDTIGSGILTNSKTAQEKPERVRGFVVASMQGFQYALDHPEEAADIHLKLQKDAPAKPIQVEQLKETATRSHTVNSKGKPLGWMDVRDWQATAALLAQYADLPGQADVSKFFTNQFIPGS